MALATDIDRHTIEQVCQDPAAVRPVFQPIVDARDGETRGHELLAVIQGPGDVPTASWFSAASEYGLAGALEARIARAGLAAVRAQAAPDCFVAVNVTAQALGSTQFQSLVGQELDRLVFEVHESEVDQGLKEVLAPFRAAGVTVAVDSCGARATPLLEIAELRPSLLKLSRRLVAGIERDPALPVAVETITAFAHRIGASVVAVGVERPEELDRLRELDVELVQGFLFGRGEQTIGGAEPTAG